MFYSLLILMLPGTIPGLAQEYTTGSFWKSQSIEKIIEPWHNCGLDSLNNITPAYLDVNWQPLNNDKSIFPGMVSRHLFSYSTAYHLTGNDKYLKQADRFYKFLISFGWDDHFGGWMNQLNDNRLPVDDEKDLFMQAYAITGLTMYYHVTRNREVLSYIDESIKIINKNAWDKKYKGGYFHSLNRDLSVLRTDKVFSPQLAPLSGYLLYLYAITREKKYLRESEDIMELVLSKFKDPKTGWYLEGFTQKWEPLAIVNQNINTGHNIEVAWVLLRLYELTDNEKYRQEALNLTNKLVNYNFDSEIGLWYKSVDRNDPLQHLDETNWWTQAYGNMYQLYLHQQTGDPRFLNYFKAGAGFWNKNLIDDEQGGAYLSVGRDGKILDSRKAVRTKTSYHSMEHGLLNYLYLDFWINQQPVDLYFSIDEKFRGKLYPLLLEEMDYSFSEVVINDADWQRIDQERGFIRIKGRGTKKLRVTLNAN